MEKMTTSMTIRMEKEVKQQAQKLFSDMGMDMTTAINIFLRQAIKEQAIPFRIGNPVPNQETLEALKEVDQMKKHPEQYKGYTDVDEMMEELLA
ncbi:MAG: type II toxin-antitoxin system RelB/DinJ family antitoxin [Oscillospiraceae bacterium]|nr:type II toxin-antitoxin system RelB/DinJ family antitoxin [Oscillospiraceae bacterium]